MNNNKKTSGTCSLGGYSMPRCLEARVADGPGLTMPAPALCVIEPAIT